MTTHGLRVFFAALAGVAITVLPLTIVGATGEHTSPAGSSGRLR